MSAGLFVLAAGGTGGHLFPAQALAERLVRRGAAVYLATDRRADAFATEVPGVDIRRIYGRTAGRRSFQTACGVAAMAVGLVQARRLLRRLQPAAVIGFGGYPSVPTMLAATQLGLVNVIHEQNAVLGRANRLLARRVRRIATGFAETPGLRPADRAARDPYREPGAAGVPAPSPTSPTGRPGRARRIELVILGGSQGARIFADIVPPALAALPLELRAALRVSQQARPRGLRSGRCATRGRRHRRRGQQLFH